MSTPRPVSRLNPANAVTASRFLTLPPFLWAVDSGYPQWATLFILVCGLLDKLDGAVAKLFDCRSAFGELFDAVTDGICYGFAMIVVVAYGWAPAIPAIAVVALGVGNTGLRFAYAKRVGRAVNYKSYAMERVVGFIAFMIGFATGRVEVDYYYWGFLPIFAIVVLHDAKRMLFDLVPGGGPMSPTPISTETFRWILTILILAGALWALFDVIKLSRTRGKDAGDPLVRDERFGYVVGIVIGLFAVSGILRYQGVW